MSAGKKFAVHPGRTTSKNDGDLHYVGVPALVALYRLRPNEYVVWNDEEPITFIGRRAEDYLHLFPLYDGNYEETIKILRGALFS